MMEQSEVWQWRLLYGDWNGWNKAVWTANGKLE